MRIVFFIIFYYAVQRMVKRRERTEKYHFFLFFGMCFFRLLCKNIANDFEVFLTTVLGCAGVICSLQRIGNFELKFVLEIPIVVAGVGGEKAHFARTVHLQVINFIYFFLISVRNFPLRFVRIFQNKYILDICMFYVRLCQLRSNRIAARMYKAAGRKKSTNIKTE